MTQPACGTPTRIPGNPTTPTRIPGNPTVVQDDQTHNQRRLGVT